MKTWLNRLLGSEPARKTSQKSAPVTLPASTATPAAAGSGFAVRRPLVAANGNVAGFEFCLPASVEERLRRKADPIAQAAHALALMSSMRSTLDSGRVALATIPMAILARPNVIDPRRPVRICASTAERMTTRLPRNPSTRQRCSLHCGRATSASVPCCAVPPTRQSSISPC